VGAKIGNRSVGCLTMQHLSVPNVKKLCPFFSCQFPPPELTLSVILTAILFSDEDNSLKNLQKCQVFVLGTFLVHESYAAFGHANQFFKNKY
jgi:hypothetical protein